MNLLITGAWPDAKENIEKLKMLGHCVVFMQYETEELPCSYDWVEGTVCNSLFLTHSIDKFVNLNFIQLTSAGFDRVPMNYVNEHGIKIFNAKGVYSIPMAEFVLAGVLQLYKQMRNFYENQKKHIWEKNRGLLELFGKKVCIIGCGSVGTECAKRFSAFGCEVIGVNRSIIVNENYKKIVGISNLDEILVEADIVVVTIGLTKQTAHLINRKRLEMLKSTAIFINIARGEIVDINALIEISPKLGGVLLDVFEKEPLCKDSVLWNEKNLIITPHNSFVGEGNMKRLRNVILKNIGEN